MYCANCGVKLADSERECPLCGTVAYHPQVTRTVSDPTYPEGQYPKPAGNRLGLPTFITAAVLVPMLTVLACDFRFTRAITWSGYVVGALLMAYVWFVLPFWFKKPNPTIFVPCGFAAAAGYLGYINFAVGGQWFLPFALPVTACFCAIVTGVIALLRYVGKGKLYIFGGAFVAFGLVTFFIEVLLHHTFAAEQFLGWSIYPTSTFILLGGFLIFLAICRPAREVMERKFFF